MDKISSLLFKIVVKIILTPVLIAVALLILSIYFVMGLILVPSQSLRYLGLTTIAAIRSAFENKEYTNVFLDALYVFLKRYILFYGQIIHIPLAIWLSAEANPSTLLDILKYEWETLSANWLSTLLIYGTLILSFAFSFSILGLKGLDYFHLDTIKNKIYIISTKNDTNATSINFQGYSHAEIDSVEKKYTKQLNKITLYYNKKIDSIKNLHAIPSSNQEEHLKISKLEKQIDQFKSKKPEVEIKYVDKIEYRDKPEPYHKYGKGNGLLFILIDTDCFLSSDSISIWIDGEYAGHLIKPQKNSNQSPFFSKVVLSGIHHVIAKHKSLGWNYYDKVSEDEIRSSHPTCK